MDNGIVVAGLALVSVVLGVRFGLFKILASWQSPAPDKDMEPRDSRRRDEAHESGHAIAAWFSPYVQRVTEVRVERMGGGEMLRSRSEQCTPQMLWDDMVINLAGISAEANVFGSFFATEAAADLLKAKANAREIARLEDYYDVQYSPPWPDEEEEPTLSDVQDFLTDPLSPRVRQIMNRAYHRALQVMTVRREQLDAVREELRQRKRLRTEHLERLLGTRPSLIANSVPPGPPPSHP